MFLQGQQPQGYGAPPAGAPGKFITSLTSIVVKGYNKENILYVSHPGEIKHKTLLLKNELNAFSNRGYFYSHFEKKIIQISQKLTKW